MPLWGHPGGPWQKQEGHERVWNWIFIDFGSIFGPYFECFCGAEARNLNLFSGLFPGPFLYRLLSRNSDARVLEARFCVEAIPRSIVPRCCCLRYWAVFFFSEDLGPVVLTFVALEKDLKIDFLRGERDPMSPTSLW